MSEVVLIGFMPADRERLGQLAQALAARGLVVDWWSVAPTKPQWINDLQGRIAAAPGVIAVWTADSAKDRWSAVAADEALERRHLISILFDGVVVPPAFRNLASLDLIGWGGEPESPALDGLVESLGLMLGQPLGRVVAVPVSAPARPVAVGSEPHPAVPVPVPAPIPLHPGPPVLPPVLPPIPPTVVRLRPVVAPEPGDPSPRETPRPPTLPPAWAGPQEPLARARDRAAPPAVVEPFPGRPSAVADLDRGLGFIPCSYGWALAWAVGMTAMGFYLLPGLQLTQVAEVYIGNPLFSAGSGGAVGLLGAGFILHALRRERIGLSLVQRGLIALAWGLGGGLGLLAAAWLSLPVVGAAAGVVGFDLGWVACWLIAAVVGSLGTWSVLRPSYPVLEPLDLAFTTGGFALGALGGWMLGWLAVAIPILILDWLLQAIVPAGAARDLGHLAVQLLSLGLIGAVGGAAFGLGGALVLFGALGRGGAAAD